MTARVSDRVLHGCAALAERDDTALAAGLLARQPVHAGRTHEELARWARLAVDAGRDAASRDGAQGRTDPDEQARRAGLTVRHAQDGLRSGWVVVAEYAERSREVRVHQDALQLAEWLVVAALGGARCEQSMLQAMHNSCRLSLRPSRVI